ncbi:MAG: hypothetical protein J0H97_15980 [Alphaproteobacteria bacterium]|jgi:hypothetical protein|nr:hypothetical protein [Alphaproteobacteria bacterium]
MSEGQAAAIATAIGDIYSEKNEGGMLCCTLEAVNSEGMDVSIQVMAETINLAPYPYADDPLSRLELSGALETLHDLDLALVDWDANAFATVGTGGNQPEAVARLINETFLKVMGCNPGYAFKASTEDLA